MLKRILIPLAIVSFFGTTANAVEITDATKCKSEVEIVKELDANHDLGDKYETVARGLIEVLENLCEEKDFKNAEDVAALVRGMYATE